MYVKQIGMRMKFGIYCTKLRRASLSPIAVTLSDVIIVTPTDIVKASIPLQVVV